MQEITITLKEYRSLIISSFIASELRSLLKQKLQDGTSIFSSEIELLCALYGIEVDEE